MKKTFISNLILMMSVNLLIKPFWILGIDLGVQNAVGYEQYGIYSNLFAFSMLFIFLLDLGINNYTSSNVARNPALLSQEFSALASFKAFSAMLYLALTLGVGLTIGYNPERIQLLALLGVNQILSYFYMFFRSIVGGLQKFRADAFLSVIDRSLMIVLCGLMLWTQLYPINILAFAWAQTLSYLVATAISFVVIKPHLHQLSYHFEIRSFLKIIRQMLPYTLLSLLMTLYTRLDVVMIKELLTNGDVQNGIYASSYRLLEAANMMAAMVAMLLLPMFSKMLASRENMNPLIQFATGVMVLPAFTFCTLAYFYKSPLIHLMNKHSTEFAAEVFGYVILCFLPLSIMYIYGTLLTAAQHFKVLISMAAVGLLINVSLNIWLIPQYEALGAGISALATQLFIGISNFILAQQKLQVRFEPKFLKRFGLAALINFLATATLQFAGISWYLTGALLGLLLILQLVVLKIIDPEQIKLLLKSKEAEKSGN